MLRNVTSENMTMEVLHASLIISPPLHVFIHFFPHSHSGAIQNLPNGWVVFFFSFVFFFHFDHHSHEHISFFLHTHIILHTFLFLVSDLNDTSNYTSLCMCEMALLFWCQDSSPKPSTSPPHLGSPGRKPHKSPSEPKERKQSSSDDKKKVVSVFIWWEAQMIWIHYSQCFCFVGGF